jgi:hypothetical protein
MGIMTDDEEIKLTDKILKSKEFRKTFASSGMSLEGGDEKDALVHAVWFFSRGYIYCLNEIKGLNE